MNLEWKYIADVNQLSLKKIVSSFFEKLEPLFRHNNPHQDIHISVLEFGWRFFRNSIVLKWKRNKSLPTDTIFCTVYSKFSTNRMWSKNVCQKFSKFQWRWNQSHNERNDECVIGSIQYTFSLITFGYCPFIKGQLHKWISYSINHCSTFPTNMYDYCSWVKRLWCILFTCFVSISFSNIKLNVFGLGNLKCYFRRL